MCEALGEVAHGVYQCSEENKPGSTCKITCGSGYDIYGRAIMTCQKTANGEIAFWTSKKPCCASINDCHSFYYIYINLYEEEA